MKSRRIKPAVHLVLALAVGAAAGLGLRYTVLKPDDSGPEAGFEAVKLGGPFTLVDQHGETVSDVDLRGRYMLVFFGYSKCPDVCPAALQDMALALEALGDKGERVQPIFISIDPGRDTPGELARYAELFHPRLLALTGTPEQIAAVAKAYGVYYAKGQSPGHGDGHDHGYEMEHSTFVYLMGPDGRYRAHFPHHIPIDDLADAIAKFL